LKQSNSLKKFFASIFLFAPMFLTSQIQQVNVKFPAGKTSTTITNTIKGEKTIDYKVSASSGQTMKVTLNTSNGSNYFNVLEPGSSDVAIYNSSENTNKFNQQLNKSGVYTIRVYLMRNAARRNETAKYSLSIGLTGGAAASTDVKVPGTNYHATGQVKSSKGKVTWGSVMSKFGVIRMGNNKSQVDVTYPGGIMHKLMFEKGEWTCKSNNCKITFERGNGDWTVTVNDNEHFIIPDEVINGG